MSASFKPNCTELVVLGVYKNDFIKAEGKVGTNGATQGQVNSTNTPHNPKVNKTEELTYLVDGQMDRWTDGWINRWMDRQTDVPMDRWSYGQMDRLSDVQSDRETDG